MLAAAVVLTIVFTGRLCGEKREVLQREACKNMTAELISVGTEILMGNILNSNARYLAEKCASLGLDMYYQVTVGDN